MLSPVAYMVEAIHKNFEIEQSQGLLMSTTITALGERQNRKVVHNDTKFTEDPVALFTTQQFHTFSPWASDICHQKYGTALTDPVRVFRFTNQKEVQNLFRTNPAFPGVCTCLLVVEVPQKMLN